MTMKGAQLNGSNSSVYEYGVLPKESGIAAGAENFPNSVRGRGCD